MLLRPVVFFSALILSLCPQLFWAWPVAAASSATFDVASARIVVDQAETAMTTGGAPMLEPLLPKLKDVLQSAMANPNDDNTIILGSQAGYAVGWYYNDVRQHQQALPPLDQAVALNADNADVASERGQALIGLRKFEEALSNYEHFLARKLTALDRARMLRGKGLALTELNRLDEAVTAYDEALALEPDHQGARNELVYIQRLRDGRAATPIILKPYQKAKNGD